MVNAALLKLIDDAGGEITISTSDLFRVAQNGKGVLAMSILLCLPSTFSA
jgi:hypothetical protein